MKRYLIGIVFFVLLVLSAGSLASYAQQLDPAKREALDQRISEYFDALKYESLQMQMSEADFMIQAASDSLIRQYVALRIYDHYIGSPVMGAEAVAIHVFDTWFDTGKVVMGDDLDLLNARIYADFNRQSLIGEKAPELVMSTMQGDTVRLFADRGRSAPDGERHKVLLFYDTDCSKCKLESILLRNLIDTEDYPIDIYAVYTGDDRKAWEIYVNDRLSVLSARTRITHLWDPQIDSDFQRKYGVIQTPRMFLVRPDGVIKGRGLDTFALSRMLEEVFARPQLEYGRAESEDYLDRLMTMTSSEGGRLSDDDVRYVADHLAFSALQAGDTTMCRQFIGDFLYYLSPKTSEWAREGMDYLIDEYITGRNDIWKSSDDSLKIIGFARIMDDLLSKAAPGSTVADLKVPGQLLRHGKKITSGNFSLRKLRGESNVIIFYTEGCHICDAEKAVAAALVADDPRYRVLMVNVDAIVASDPAMASRLFDTFDLSSLPLLIETDKKGKIIRRYITLQ